MADQLIRLDSYPFDSNLPTQYDELGYPVFDRGITSHILAACWKQFFSNGIFAAPATNLQITRGTGFSINIAKGIGIIDGHMGGVFNDDGMNIQLTTEARGTKTYSIMLRYDNNNEYRSNYIRIVENVGSEPIEPEIAPKVKELRLGYVTIPNNAESIEEATIIDERGTSVCPYTAPFMEIDIASVIEEVKHQAGERYDDFVNYLIDNMEFIASAIDGTVAGQLQNQINEIKSQLGDIDLSDKIDDTTIEYTADSEFGEKKLRLKDGAVTADKLAEGAITADTIPDGTITTEKIADRAVTPEKIQEYEYVGIKGISNYGYSYPWLADSMNTEVIGYGEAPLANNVTTVVPLISLNISNSGTLSLHYDYGIGTINAPNITSVGGVNALNLLSLRAENAEYFIAGAFLQCKHLREIWLNKITEIPANCFGSISFSMYNVENVQDIASSAFSNCTILNDCHFDNLTAIGYNYYLSFMGDVFFSKLNYISNVSFYGLVSLPMALSLNYVYLYSGCYVPNVTNVKGVYAFGSYYEFPMLSQMSSQDRIYLFHAHSINKEYTEPTTRHVTLRLGSNLANAGNYSFSSSVIGYSGNAYYWHEDGRFTASIYLDAPSMYKADTNPISIPSQPQFHYDIYFPSSLWNDYMAYNAWSAYLSNPNCSLYSF